MESRIQTFENLREDIWFCKLFKKLSKLEIQECREFIKLNDSLDNNEFELKVNRYFLDKPKPTNWVIMTELISSSKK